MYISPDNEAVELPLATDTVPETEIATEVADDDENASIPTAAWKPDIAHLSDAVVDHDGNLVFSVEPGEGLVIDYTNLKYGPWLDTRLWIVQRISPNGDVALWDPNAQQCGMTNWKIGHERGLVFKLPGSRTSWWVKPVTKKVQRVEVDSLKGSGRGRPKGSINSKTRDRLIAAGHDPETMSAEEIGRVMADIRKDDYENAKTERRQARKQEKEAR